jgi:AraC-like DNA-binding protein
MIESLNGTHENVNFQSSNIVRFYYNKTDECFPPHWHIPGEIIAPLEGTYTLTIAGESLTIQPGDILLIAPGELHEIQAPPVGVRYIINYAPAPFESVRDISFLFGILRPYYLVQGQKEDALSRRLQDLLHQMYNEYFGEATYSEGAIFALMMTFFVELGRHTIKIERFLGSTQSKQQEYTTLFISVCNYINQHCTENLSLEEMAKNAGFSKYHFCRLFKEFTGTTFHDYLTTSRILWAKNLLGDSDISITEISMRSGFNSLSTFNRIFKDQLGCTPSEYRKLNSSSTLVSQ